MPKLVYIKYSQGPKQNQERKAKMGKNMCCDKPITLSNEINGKKPCCLQFCNGMQTQNMLSFKMKKVWSSKMGLK
jgi:hypothetical protein